MATRPPIVEAPREARLALRRLAVIALLAVLLGFVMQGIILAATLTGSPHRDTVFMSLAQGVTWSVLICSGVALSTAIANGRPLLVGALALFFAPIALAIAKASQKVMAGWLGAAESEAVLSLGTISVLRGVEYGLLGWLLGRLVLREVARPWSYLGAGAAAGLLFGGAISVLTWRTAMDRGAPLPQPKLVATVINEVLFPIGCALVIFFGQLVGRTLRMAEDANT